jgi:hypothetical protein
VGRIIESGIRAAIWWASNPYRVVGTVGTVWLNTLKGPIGNWSRAMTWQALKWGVRSAGAGIAFTSRTTFSKLILPAVANPVVQAFVLPVVAAVVVTAVVVTAQQQVGLIGPTVQTAEVPFPSLEDEKGKGFQLNPFMMGWGSVV